MYLKRIAKSIINEFGSKDYVKCEEFYNFLERNGCEKGELEEYIEHLGIHAKYQSKELQKILKKIVDVPRLWKWTKKDLIDIYNKTFYCIEYDDDMKCIVDDGPSNSFAVILACFFDLWGGILNKRFGQHNTTASNIGYIIVLLQKHKKTKNGYKTIDGSRISNIFRNNLIHCFGKSPKGHKFDLNITTEGKPLEIIDGTRTNINVKKLYQDFIIVVGDELKKVYKI